MRKPSRKLPTLLAALNRDGLYRPGLRTAIIWASPMWQKSSLLNALSGLCDISCFPFFSPIYDYTIYHSTLTAIYLHIIDRNSVAHPMLCHCLL